MKQLIIQKNDAGQRLDKFLQKYFKRTASPVPLSYLYKAIRTNKIKVNRKKVPLDYILQDNDQLDLYIKEEFLSTVKPIQKTISNHYRPLTILYEDENILLVDKPFGLPSQPDQSQKNDTLIDQVKGYLARKTESSYTFSPALCNRLDRNTRGIVVACKNASALRILNEKIRNREVHKYYLCIVKGHLKEKSGTLTHRHLKNSQQNIAFIATNDTEGKEMITHYRVLDEMDNSSLLEIELVTGRSHQIRLQFSAIGHPLLGDPKYGDRNWNQKMKQKHQQLIAYKIHFTFTTESFELTYLNHQTFTIPKDQISLI